MLVRLRNRLALSLLTAALAGCGSTTVTPARVTETNVARGARDIVGTSLVGVSGKTEKDQQGIDNAVAGLCGAGSYTPTECRKHAEETQK